MGHARAILAIDSAKKQEQLAERVVKRNLNVRQTEMLAAAASTPKTEQPEKEKDIFTRDAEEKLARTLRSKVEIDRKRRGGVIHIRFGSEDELIRLVEELMGRRR
jgi:ParB family chromosome partitioning protein